MRPRIWCFALLCIILPHRSFSGDHPRSIAAVRTTTPPVVDGSLGDRVWILAHPATDFIQRDPVDGDPSRERTEVRVLYDSKAMYFGWMCYDSRPEAIVSRLARRDDEIPTDWASVRIDADHDGLTAFEFTFSVAGVQIDILQFDDGEDEDDTWDAVWDLQVSRVDSGWSAELMIPFGMLRYPSAPDDTTEQVWGINFVRYITRLNERSHWAHTLKSEAGFISRFGHLRGLMDLPQTRPVELLPFTVVRSQHDPGSGTVLPVNQTSLDGGLDVKYGLGSNLTLDMTVRPDFGQVEADPAVLNLTTIETFYPERRPFFIEGSQITGFPTFGDDGGLFYSRRIGSAVDPEDVDVPPGGGVRDVPSNVGIIGAAKVTGRLPGGLSIGALQAVTQRERATIVDSSGASSGVIVAEPASFSVLRLRKEVAPLSTLGGILTAVLKEQRRPAFTAGADWALRFGNSAYLADGFLAGSYTTGDEDERVSGSAGRVRIARVGAVHWLWEIQGDYTTPRYDINDVGFFRRPNDFGLTGRLSYVERTPDSWYQQYSLALQGHERWNFDQANLIRQGRLSGSLLFRNYWQVTANAGVDVGVYDDRETRGNGLYAKPAASTATVYLYSDQRKTISVKVGQRFGWDAKTEQFTATELGLLLRPVGWLELEVETEYQHRRGKEAWVENVDLTDGTASIFADRTTEQIDLQVSGIVVFARNLTLEFYGQIFAARGIYENYRRLLTPSTFAPFDFTGEPDFLSQSIIGNVVVRWEYRPGSTVYLVWSHARDSADGSPDALLADGLRDAFRLPAANVVLLKVNYWLSL